MGRGMIDKLILDEDGYVCTYTKHANGKEVISYENEIFPIIDAFVREHPDFSFRGARGTLFFTGFDGICGYRTQSEPVNDREGALGLDRQNEIAEASVIIEALREEGWTFGCHGYNHRHMPTLTEEQFKWEIDAWREEVGAIVGDTGLFCWPYGDHGYGDLRKGDLHKYMFDRGFYFYFGTGAGTYYADELDELGIFSDRKGVTGQALLYIAADYGVYVKYYTPLFDKDKIWDPLRLPYKDWLLEEFNKKMNG
jgi:peptidoglycan/xylan/chitin deacetylase (PgdA/CDA1 family)